MKIMIMLVNGAGKWWIIKWIIKIDNEVNGENE